MGIHYNNQCGHTLHCRPKLIYYKTQAGRMPTFGALFGTAGFVIAILRNVASRVLNANRPLSSLRTFELIKLPQLTLQQLKKVDWI